MNCPYFKISVLLALVLFTSPVFSEEPNDPHLPITKAAVIPCHGMIDQGLFESIQRRTQLAIDQNFTYIFYDIDTFGGELQAAFNISSYLLQNVNTKADTVAYVSKKAISAGALISVACEDIIMKEKTLIGDSAPIVMGGKLEGVEREKIESVTREVFVNSAQANNYPQALLEAMVTQQLTVYAVRNISTDQVEYFKSTDLPKDSGAYDLDNKKLVVRDDELLTLTAKDALTYGVARAEVQNFKNALEFIEKRDNVAFQDEPTVFQMLWSEQMVRWINSPAVMGILIMLAMLGVYIELNSPGVGLSGLLAVICIVIIVGSKYMTGLANWVEVALFFTGIVLLLIEFLVIPGFGIAGISGIICIAAGLFGMLIKNPPDKLPWPQSILDWQLLISGVQGIIVGVIGFVFLSWLLSKFIPKAQFLSGLSLAPSQTNEGQNFEISMTSPAQTQGAVKPGDRGIVFTTLRPAGKVKFGEAIVDCICPADFLEKGTQVEITEIHGNRVVVKRI